MLGRQPAQRAIRQAFEEYGFRGIKFNGAQDGYVIDDPELSMPLIEQAAAYGKPLAFHIGADFYENTHPYRLGRIATALPDTQLIMIHMGGAALPPLHRAAIEVATTHPNIHLIGSGIPEGPVLQAITELGADRISFGSDAPFRMMHVQLAKYRALLRDAPAADVEAVLGGNILRVLGVA